jgi:hypothetical protein
MPMPLADYAAYARNQFMNVQPGNAMQGYAGGRSAGSAEHRAR